MRVSTFALLLLSFCLAAPALAARPNVVLVMTDDQGYGDLSCHGNPVVETPNLDRLYDESIRLTDFHVAPMCTPTRGQLMTGIDAMRNGAMNVSSGRTLLRTEFPTMADFFAEGGYATGIFGKWHLGDNYPCRPHDRGFEEAVWFPSSHINSVPDFWNNDYFDDTYLHKGRRQKYEGYCTDLFFSLAKDWMETCRQADRPFFVYLPLNAAHSPHYVPERYRVPVRKALARELPNLPKIPQARQQALVSFLAMIANIDENMGRLDDYLRESGLRDDTLLIFLTDNGSTMGPHYYNADMRGGKVTLWEGGHRVPCFLRWPGGKLVEPRDLDALAQVQDLLPTLIDLCDLSPKRKARFDGVSLARLLRGEVDRLDDRMLVVNYSRMPFSNDRPRPVTQATPRREGAAVLWRRWRLLEDRQLYDLNDDFHQDRDVIAQHPEVAAKMSARLDAWWDGVKDRVNEPGRVIIGHEAENPMLLTACEWFDVFIDQQKQVRRADLKNGVWHLEVARAGIYELKLRRWPREADLALAAPALETPVVDDVLPAGKALPIGQARIRIGTHEGTQPVGPEDRAAVFRFPLEPGPVELETAFLTAEGKEICGAYYVDVERLD